MCIRDRTKTVRLSGAPNFRDIAGEGSGIAVTGGRMKRGIAYRSSTTSSITRMDKFILQTLDVGTLVALSPSSVANVTGIDRARYQLNNPSSQTLAEKKRMYAQYVSSAANRASIGKAIQFLAGSDEAVVFQCLRGWDRTGGFAAVIPGLLGASSSTIMSEFLDVYKRQAGGRVTRDAQHGHVGGCVEADDFGPHRHAAVGDDVQLHRLDAGGGPVEAHQPCVTGGYQAILRQDDACLLYTSRCV